MHEAPDTERTKDAPAQQPRPQVIDLDANRHSYDVEALERFLAVVFHVEPRAQETVLTWAVKARPGYPSTPGATFKVLRRTSTPRALYYGTSTCAPEGDTLYNRAALFQRLHVVVLDDIGTKIPLATLPDELREGASYIIESSPGNFQYGYVLDTPVDVLEQAQALIHLVYDSGMTDSGGALPTKLVRLPGGVNGKVGPNITFPVTLTHLSERRWSPQELLTAVGCPTAWAAVVKDAPVALRRPQATSVTPWSPVALASPNLDGGTDPVLEWLYAQDMVLQETDEWVTIRCPQHATHTAGDDTAGYSPLGRGPNKLASQRGFHCFHEHCQDFRSAEFLSWVASDGGPEAGVWDESTHLLREWVYDPVDDLCYKIYGQRMSGGIKLGAMRSVYRGKVIIHTLDGKTKRINEVENWLNAPNKVLVNGIVSDPTTLAPLVDSPGQYPQVNVFTRPDWGDGEWYDDDVEMFTAFLAYLIPREDERNFFLDWLAAKVQNMGFRGMAMLMIAPEHGTGRGTLADIITTLLGRQNVVTLTFDKLVGANDFNDWQLKSLAITNETLDLGDAQNFYRAYERLKGLVETQPSDAWINPKGVTARAHKVYTSYLLFSNHAAAMAIPAGDRRIYVITNAQKPASREYFTELYAWKNEIDPDTGQPPWAPSVARWLCAREVDVAKLIVNVAPTAGKAHMFDTAANPVDLAVNAVIKHWKGRFMVTAYATHVVQQLEVRLGMAGRGNLAAMVRASMKRHTAPMNTRYRCRMPDGPQARPALLRRALDEEAIRLFQDGTSYPAAAIVAEITQNDLTSLVLHVRDELALHDI